MLNRLAKWEASRERDQPLSAVKFVVNLQLGCDSQSFDGWVAVDRLKRGHDVSTGVRVLRLGVSSGERGQREIV
jgi:hypothetical protein